MGNWLNSFRKHLCKETNIQRHFHYVQKITCEGFLTQKTALLPNVQDGVIVFSVPGPRRRLPLDCLPELMHAIDRQPQVLSKMLAQEFSQGQINQASGTGQT